MNRYHADKLLKQWAQWWVDEINRMGASAPRFYNEIPGGDWQDRELPEPKEPDTVLERVDATVSYMRREGMPKVREAGHILVSHYRDHERRHNYGAVDFALREFVTAWAKD